MTHKMPGRLNRLRSRKRKSSSEVKSTRTAATRRSMRNPKMHPAAESSTAVRGYSKADCLERLPVSCKCPQSTRTRKCPASPELDDREGKENKLETGLDLDGRAVTGTLGKQEAGDTECEETGKSMFPDDDSNQILPVEQFFGNLEVVQDFPQRPSETSGCFQRERRRRRRHYYAREDSNEEEAGLRSTQGD